MTERQLTYDGVGATAGVGFPAVAGFRCFSRSVRVGAGAECWDRASSDLLAWAVKTRSGFAVEPDVATASGRIVAGADYWLVARFGPLRVREPVRVVAVIVEPDRIGYAYGTLVGHPIAGEESFVLTRRADGSVWFTLRSITRPASGRWRVLFPGVLIAQRWYRWRYLRALR
jgi:uncharacterized protein (UPF0548 family)